MQVSAPVGLTVKHIDKSPGPAILNWTAVAGALWYTIDKKLPKTNVFFTVSNTTRVATWTDTARFAAPGTQYRVSVTTSDGTSPFSEPITL